MKYESHEEIFRVRAYETGADGVLKVSAIVDYFQELAGLNASDLKFSVSDLLPKNLTWVLAKYHLIIHKYPKWKDKIKVVTWPSGFESLYASREFEIFDEDNNLLVSASSIWLLINIESKRPVKPAENLGEFNFIKRKAIENTGKTIPKIEKNDYQLPFRARMNDIDMNQHVNNEVYIEWALETVPEKYFALQPFEIEVIFKKEAFYGQKITSLTQILQESRKPVFLHQIIRDDDSVELARIRSAWKNFI